VDGVLFGIELILAVLKGICLYGGALSMISNKFEVRSRWHFLRLHSGLF